MKLSEMISTLSLVLSVSGEREVMLADTKTGKLTEPKFTGNTIDKPDASTAHIAMLAPKRKRGRPAKKDAKIVLGDEKAS